MLSELADHEYEDINKYQDEATYEQMETSKPPPKDYSLTANSAYAPTNTNN